MKSIIVFAAHPDDEVLGCGGTIAKLIDKGCFVHIAFLADGVFSRNGDALMRDEELIIRRTAAQKACSILGVKSISFDNFPDNSMDSLPLLEITKVLERLIDKYQPDTVFTHHGGDVNIDHRILYNAAVTACRPHASNPVKSFFSFEIPSSTEWQLPRGDLAFMPNWFEDISPFLEVKIAALEAYAEEIRVWPHPRSIDGVKYLAHWRGCTVGVDAAEAFILGRKVV